MQSIESSRVPLLSLASLCVQAKQVVIWPARVQSQYLIESIAVVSQLVIVSWRWRRVVVVVV